MKDLSHLLFLDIETVPLAPSFAGLPAGLRGHWLKKVSAQLRGEPDPEAAYADKAGVYAEFAKVVCIGIGYLNQSEDGRWQCILKAFSDDDEATLLERLCAAFSRFASQQKGLTLVGHNIKEFDLPFLGRRMLVHGMALPDCLCIQDKKPWEVPHIDTLEWWKFGDRKSFTSLALIAEVLGLPTPKDDISGADVGRVYWEDRDLPRIAVYCLKDVYTTARVYLRLAGRPEIVPDPVHV